MTVSLIAPASSGFKIFVICSLVAILVTVAAFIAVIAQLEIN